MAISTGFCGQWQIQTSEVKVPDSFKDTWSIVILPDVQYYSDTYPGLLELQTAWIKNNADRIGVQYVLMPGDITNHNTDREWENASVALAMLDKKVPYAMCTGNHDCGEKGASGDRSTKMDLYFPYKRLAGWSGIAGVKTKGQMSNTYHLFKGPDGSRWLILALEWAPTDDTLEWAGKILEKYRNRNAILMTHAYLYHDSTLYDWKTKEKQQEWNPHFYPTPNGNDGQEIWDKLVRRHDNVFLVLSGHVIGDGTGLLISDNDAGRPVIQKLINYQSPIQEIGGSAWLRVITFSKDLKKITCWSYSPLLKQYRTEEDQLFELIKIEP
jgi:3',5'-cyclic AMP phosphodiesterase CpdA